MAVLTGAHDFQVENSQFNDHSSNVNIDLQNSTINATNVDHVDHITVNNVADIKPAERLGLQKLLTRCIPEATHDSSARHPPPLCHPGTRDEYIDSLTQWCLSSDSHFERITWVKGPAGVGKSAIAQSCANALGDKLGASFFFSRPNRRDDPNRFFTTLAYQLAVRNESSGYGGLLDKLISRDSTIITKAMHVQFEELLVTPIRLLQEQGETFPDKVIFVDGLDECKRTDAQQDIVRIVAKSLRDRTTPFLWIFFSRLESHITSTFKHPDIYPLTVHVELIISRDLDQKIFRFLADKLAEIRQKHDLEESWPREDDLHTVVDLSSGLFAYAHALALFIDDPDSMGPKDQLRIVLRLAKRIKLSDISKHPLSALDFFYSILILERLPQTKLQAIRSMLLATRLGILSHDVQIPDGILIANILGKTQDQLHDLCQSLHSVMILDPQFNLKFYHASFMDFLEDTDRSGKYCIWSDSVLATLFDQVQPILDKVSVVSGHNRQLVPKLPLSWDVPNFPSLQKEVYTHVVRAFFMAIESGALASDADTPRLDIVKDFDFRKAALEKYMFLKAVKPEKFRSNIEKIDIIRLLKRQNIPTLLRKLLTGKDGPRYYAIGQGEKVAVLLEDERGELWIHPFSEKAIKKFMLDSHQEPEHDAF